MNVGHVDPVCAFCLVFNPLDQAIVSPSTLSYGLSVSTAFAPSSVGIMVGNVPSALYSNGSTAILRANPPPFGSFSRMVEKIWLTLELCHAAMVGERTGVAKRHDLSHIFPRTCRAVAHGISDMLGHPTGGIQKIILAVSLVEPRSLRIVILIFLILLPQLWRGGTETLHGLLHYVDITRIRHHVVIQLHIEYLRITPIEISLSVVIDINSRIDICPIAIHKRLADSILERTRRESPTATPIAIAPVSFEWSGT